jgi:hypothetical protein
MGGRHCLIARYRSHNARINPDSSKSVAKATVGRPVES